VASVAQKGFLTSLYIVIGHAVLELAVVASFYLGVLKYVSNDLVVKIISISGGVFLLYMAASIIISVARKKINLELDLKVSGRSLGTRNSFIIVGKGILISLVNPYWYVWWITIGAAFMLKSVSLNTAGVSAFYTGHILADFIWYLFIGVVVSTGRRFLNKKVYLGILIACSLFLIYLGIKFILDFTLK
jgi:threonine/homoserine/homoserine lactone efflux protein